MEVNAYDSLRKPVVLDLFCGAGGMSLGFAMAGYEVALGVEKDIVAARTHAHNFEGRCHQGDIHDITDPEQFIQDNGIAKIDVIIGGPPCQGFTRVGRGKIRSLRRDPTFIHDPRNQFYLEFIRFVRTLKPLYFVMENVPDLLLYRDEDGQTVLDRALAIFRDELGYKAESMVLHADHYGVPQKRKRLFIVGNRIGQEVYEPTKTHEGTPITLWNAISDLPIISHKHRLDEMPYIPRHVLNTYQQLMREGAGTTLYNHQTRYHNPQDLEAFMYMPEGGKYIDLPEQYKRYRDDIFKDKYRKLYRNQPSWTIEAHIGKDSYRHIYPSVAGEPEPARTISVREAARLQSFPDRFRFCGPFTRQFYQLGNAVPPLLANAVALSILPALQASLTEMEKQCKTTPAPQEFQPTGQPVEAG
jgi:DNA (cytosine-5)-methyltransferase 1